MSQPTVSVIIVNWNGLASLHRCLESVSESFTMLDGQAELILIDNASTDGSLDDVHTRHSDVVIIRNDQNLGFSRGANQGIRRARGQFVALLNNDVVCDPAWLRALVDAFKQHDRIGAAGAELRYMHDRGRVNSAGIAVDVLGRARDRCDGSTARPGSSPIEVFGVSAGAALYRRELLDEIGLLDERYFAYIEDVDLAWRAQRFGWRSVTVPQSVVFHEHSATSSRVRGLKAYLSARNTIWTLAKNASPRQLLLAAPTHLLLGLWSVALAVARRDPSGPKGFVAGLTGVGPFLRERHGPYLPFEAFERPRVLAYRRATRARRLRTRR